MRPPSRPGSGIRTAVLFALLFASPLVVSSEDESSSGDRAWRIRIEPTFIDAGGHDPHVLDVTGSGGTTAVSLETDSGVGHQAHFRRNRSSSRWGWGVDFFWFTGAQNRARTNVATGAGDAVTYRVPGAEFTSTGPGEVLYYERQPDTDMNAWVLDFYALRDAFASGDRKGHWLLGVRSADFDSDYHAAVGVQGVGGTFFDAFSNYGRMHGPLVGLTVETTRGRQRFEGQIAQSIVFGDADLLMVQSGFEGEFIDENQNFLTQRTFSRSETVSIPITDLRLRWVVEASRSLSLGLGAAASHWAGVSVPPGVRPSADIDAVYESSITFIGLSALVEVNF